MSDNYPVNEQLYRYFDGELEGEEKNAFEAELANSPELRESLESLKLSRYAVNRLGLLQQVGAIHQEFAGTQTAEAATPVKRLNWKKIGMAAAAAVVLFLGVWMLMPAGVKKQNAEELYASVYKPYDLPQVRSGNGSVLEQAYKAHHYKQALALYKALATPPSQQENLVAACAAMEIADWQTAETALLSIQTNNRINSTADFADDAEYYLALTYLKQGKKKEAGTLFTKISQTPNHSYADKITPAFIQQFNKLP